MNFAQLEYIIAVDTVKHFAKAAELSFVTQPTLSMMIKKLEIELGVQIFDRSEFPVRTTVAGRQVIQQARSILLEKERLFEMLNQEKISLEGTFRLGIIPTLAPYLLPLFIPSFVQKYTKIQLEVVELTTKAILRDLHNNELDAAILATPLSKENIEEIPLFNERFFLYSDIPNQKSYILPTEIDLERLLLLEEGHCLRSQALNLCEMQERVHQSLSYRIGSIETLMNLVDRGQGSTIIPELALSNLLPARIKQVVSFLDPVPTRQISLIKHSSLLKNAIIEALVEEIVSSLPKSILQNKSSYTVPI